MKEYKTILNPGREEFIIKKSRFIGYCKSIDHEEEALDFIESIKNKHWDATHNCHAYKQIINMVDNVQSMINNQIE